jgi:hypothetical protein
MDRRIVVTLLLCCVFIACAPSKSSQGRFAEPDLFDTSAKNLPPNPEIDLVKECDEGVDVVVSVEANDIDSDKLLYLYDFDGNGSFEYVGSKSVVKHAWKQNGKYKVHVRVQDSRGGVGDAYASIKVVDRGPTAAFRQIGNATEGSWVAFDARNSSSPSDSIVSYEWDWNYNGTIFRPAKVRGRKVENRWNKNGDYVVALRIIDSDGSKQIVSKVVTVRDQSPVPRIKGPKSLLVGQKAVFSGRDSRSVVDKIVGYYWDTNFDGEFTQRVQGSRDQIALTLKTVGVHRIALQVEDADGSKVVASYEVRVNALKEKKEPKEKQVIGKSKAKKGKK